MRSAIITIALRRRATGYKEGAFMCEDLNAAWTFANILVRSQEFAHCYAVATNWRGDVVFTCPREQAPAPAPVHLPAPGYGHRSQAHVHQAPAPHDPRYWAPQHRALPAAPRSAPIIDAELVDDHYLALPPKR